MTVTPEPRQIVLNPGGGPYRIEDLDGFLESFPADEEPMIDLGGGMIVPLRELADDLDDPAED